MYKVDFDSFFIQLQCPFLYHASVETYLTIYLKNSSILTTVNLRKSSSFGPHVQVSFLWSAESQMDKILLFLNTEILIISIIIERFFMAKKLCIKFISGGQPLSQNQPLQNLLPAKYLSTLYAWG